MEGNPSQQIDKFINIEDASIETELKMILPTDASEAAIMACLCEKGYAVEEQGERENRDIYLDTDGWLLLKNRQALRYRVTNGEALYTVKGLGYVESGIAKRVEKDFKLAGSIDIPADVTEKGVWDIIDGIIRGGKLDEKILITTKRRLYRLIPPEGGEIELAFDTSTFQLGGTNNSQRIGKLREMEAELINGPVEILKTIAALIIEQFNYSPSSQSKLEYAMKKLGVAVF